MRKKYVKELHRQMEEDFGLNSRVEKYSKKIESQYSEIYGERTHTNRSRVRWAIMAPVICVLSCVTGVGATYVVLKTNGLIVDKENQNKVEDYIQEYNEYVTLKDYSKLSTKPDSSYYIGNNTNMYIYSAKKADSSIDFICQIYSNTSNKTEINVKFRNIDDDNYGKTIVKKINSSSIIEVINTDGFEIFDNAVNATIIFNDVAEETNILVNLYTFL